LGKGVTSFFLPCFAYKYRGERRQRTIEKKEEKEQKKEGRREKERKGKTKQQKKRRKKKKREQNKNRERKNRGEAEARRSRATGSNHRLRRWGTSARDIQKSLIIKSGLNNTGGHERNFSMIKVAQTKLSGMKKNQRIQKI